MLLETSWLLVQQLQQILGCSCHKIHGEREDLKDLKVSELLVCLAKLKVDDPAIWNSVLPALHQHSHLYDTLGKICVATCTVLVLGSNRGWSVKTCFHNYI